MLDEYDQWRRQNAGLYRDVSPSAFRDASDLRRLRQQVDALKAFLGEKEANLDPDSKWIIWESLEILEGRE